MGSKKRKKWKVPSSDTPLHMHLRILMKNHKLDAFLFRLPQGATHYGEILCTVIKEIKSSTNHRKHLCGHSLYERIL